MPVQLIALFNGALKYWKLIGFGLLVLLLGVQTARIEGLKVWPINIPGLKAELQAEKDGRAADRKAYEQAQKDAAAKNEAQVKRIVDEQDRISSNVEQRYKADRERMRIELERQLRSRPEANQGSPRGSKAGPDIPSSPGPSKEAPVCISPRQYVQGAETELQLDRLVDLLEEQFNVPR